MGLSGLRQFCTACSDLSVGPWSFLESSESRAVENKSLARMRSCTTTGAGDDESRPTGDGVERKGKGETERGEVREKGAVCGVGSSGGGSSRGGSSNSLIAESDRVPPVSEGWLGGRA